MNDYDDDFDPCEEYNCDDDGNQIWDYADEYDDEPDLEDYDYLYEWQQEATWDAYWRSARGRLHKAMNVVKYHVSYVIHWLKWHNHKCKYCGKPALYDGEICDHCIF